MDGYLTLDEAYLMHHGVKGMHWGVRKQRSNLGVGRRALMGVGTVMTKTPMGKAGMAIGKTKKAQSLNNKMIAKTAARQQAKAAKKAAKQRELDNDPIAKFDSKSDRKARKAAGQLGVNINRTAQDFKNSNYAKDAKRYYNQASTTQVKEYGKGLLKSTAKYGAAMAVGGVMRSVGNEKLATAGKLIQGGSIFVYATAESWRGLRLAGTEAQAVYRVATGNTHKLTEKGMARGPKDKRK